jgi:hypothetical protein
MPDSRVSPEGVPPFHVHSGHAFEGFELAEAADGSPMLLARCNCGQVLDVADARFAVCPECTGSGGGCARCAGTGRVVDHTALQWRVPV